MAPPSPPVALFPEKVLLIAVNPLPANRALPSAVSGESTYLDTVFLEKPQLMAVIAPRLRTAPPLSQSWVAQLDAEATPLMKARFLTVRLRPPGRSRIRPEAALKVISPAVSPSTVIVG